jgi:MGT family glycosyltransferase
VRIIWVGWRGGGGVPPQLAVCEALLEAGHEVAVIADPQVGPQAERIGARFEAIDEPPLPAGATWAEVHRWALQEKFLGSTYAEAMSAAIDRHEPDRVLVDGALFSAQVEARASDIPYAALWVQLALTAENWTGGTDPRDQVVNLAAHNAHRNERGLAQVTAIRDTHLDADWLLTLSYETLNRARRRNSPNLHFVGAPLPKTAEADVELPPGDAPLVLVGFSTTPITTAADLQTVVDGLGGMDVRALVTLGRVEPGELELPPNVVETRFAPHDQVLPHADLMVSHVGHGSLCAAARHGVPILALPWGRDQHANAQTLTDMGIGSTLPSGSTAEEIGDAAGRLLADDDIRRTCSDVAAEIATQPGLDRAVQLITGPPK